MDYARALVPLSVLRRLAAACMTLRARLPALAKPRRFRLSAHGRSQRSAVAAASLDDLLRQARSVCLLNCRCVTLVLEDDGTAVETEESFRSLPENTRLMVLEKGQIWTRFQDVSVEQTKKTGILKVTVNLYKLQPKDFVGSLNIKVRLYSTRVVSYDIRCSSARTLALSCTRLVLQTTSLVARLLLHSSTLLLHHLAEDA